MNYGMVDAAVENIVQVELPERISGNINKIAEDAAVYAKQRLLFLETGARRRAECSGIAFQCPVKQAGLSAIGSPQGVVAKFGAIFSL